MLINVVLMIRPYIPPATWVDDESLFYGAAIVLCLMVSVAGGVLGYFKNKKREKHAALERVLARRGKKPK